MKTKLLNTVLRINIFAIVILGLSTCNSSKNVSSTADMFKIPKKIIKAEDLPPALRKVNETQVHYVQLFPDDIPEDTFNEAIEPIIANTQYETIIHNEPIIEPMEEKMEIEQYVDEVVDNLIHSRKKPDFYHIVSGSFQNKLYADLFADHLKNIGYGNTYVQFFDNGYNRVIVQRYSNEVEARQYLQGYRLDNPLYADAWLYYKIELNDDPIAYLMQ